MFTGNDALEYIEICDGRYDNTKYKEFEAWGKKHIHSKHDYETGEDIITSDVIDWNGIYKIAEQEKEIIKNEV